jgi:preprotein translocase subunit Sec61beta
VRVLVISNEFYPPIKPTSKMVYRILTYLVSCKDCEIDVISCASDDKIINVFDNLHNYHIVNYSSKDKLDKKRHSLIRFFYKMARKIYSIFCPRQLFDSGRFYRRGLMLSKKKQYDAVLAFSGYFAEHSAAFKLAKKTHLPLYLFYADPFFYNVSFTSFSKTRLLKIETKWLSLAKKCFMPKNYLNHYLDQYKGFANKFVECELAGFFDERELSVIHGCKLDSRLIVYAGSFFFNWRRPDLFIRIASQLTNFKFLVLGHLDYSKFGINKVPTNILISERLSGDEYLKAIGNAGALFLEDNSFPEQIPYKAFEYLSTGKPIIFSTENILSSTSLLLNNYENKYIINRNLNSVDGLMTWLDKSTSSQEALNKKKFIKYTTEYIGFSIWKEINER